MSVNSEHVGLNQPEGQEWKNNGERETDPLVEKNLPVTKPKARKKGFVIILTLISALGGFLFGYDTGVVSGAMLEIRSIFVLNSTWIEVLVSVTIAAAAVSAFTGGFLCDLIGRRLTLIIASLVFTAGAIIMGAAVTAWMLLIGRLVVGVGIGLAAMAVPMYIAESAPTEMRGMLVVVNVAFITGGQFVATLVDGAFSYLSNKIGWRFMLGLGGVPSLVMFVGLLLMPETPRWLVFHGRSEKARKVLEKIHPHDRVSAELQSIIDDFEESRKSKMKCGDFIKKFCSNKPVLLALMVGCGLQIFQQFGGINTVMYYGASIIQMAGFDEKKAIWFASIPGGANFIFTLVGLLLVDRIGRRKLLISSVCCVIFSLLLLSVTFFVMDHFSLNAQPYNATIGKCAYHHCGSCVGNSECGFCANFDVANEEYYNGTCSLLIQLQNGTSISQYISENRCLVAGERGSSSHDSTDIISSSNSSSLIDLFERHWYPLNCPGNKIAPLAIVAIFLYIAAFAPGFGPLPWTINSEIYPTWARSTAISIATMCNWIFNLIVSMTFLSMSDSFGQPATFGFYACLTFIGLLFIIFLVPETRGKSLEEVESLFQRPHFMNWWR